MFTPVHGDLRLAKMVRERDQARSEAVELGVACDALMARTLYIKQRGNGVF